MENNSFEKKGLEIYKKFFEYSGASEEDKWSKFGRKTIDNLYVELWARNQHLSLESRLQITIAIFAALGRDVDLERLIQRAVLFGIEKETIEEILIHVTHYAGWPVWQTDARVAKKSVRKDSRCSARPLIDDRIVFCDFDQTITTKETFVGMFEIFAPLHAKPILDELNSGNRSIKDSVKSLLNTIDYERFEDIKKYYRECSHIRDGFREFVKFLKQNNIEFVIISGGMKRAIEEVLKDKKLFDWVDKNNIYGAEIYRDENDKLDAYCKFKGCKLEYEDELVPKVYAIIDYLETKYQNTGPDKLEIVFIGDGQTDKLVVRSLEGNGPYASYIPSYVKSSLVFARDTLSELLDEGTYKTWNDFRDIQRCLEERWQL